MGMLDFLRGESATAGCYAGTTSLHYRFTRALFVGRNSLRAWYEVIG